MKLGSYGRIGICEALQHISTSLGTDDFECDLVSRLSNQRRAVDADNGKLSLRWVQRGGSAAYLLCQAIDGLQNRRLFTLPPLEVGP
jgi:hypothetical protein